MLLAYPHEDLGDVREPSVFLYKAYDKRQEMAAL